MPELLNKLKEEKIMAAVLERDGTLVGSNFTPHEGVEAYIASSFNVGDAFLREVGEEAKELVISTDRGNLIIRNMGGNKILFAQIQTREQYAAYKKLVGGTAKKAEKAGK